MNESGSTTYPGISSDDSTTVQSIKDTESVAKREEASRDAGGKFLPGHELGGRPKETEEDKIKKQARKEALEKIKEEYLAKLTEALPEIQIALINKAKEKDISAIREVNDRVLGKPTQRTELTGKDGEGLNINLIQYGDNNSKQV